MSSVSDDPSTVHVTTDARRELDEALGLASTLHEPGQRTRYRALLERAIRTATHALAACGELSEIAALCGTLARAHRAKADDALHGANQLSQSAQRAPTRESCNEGWQRVTGFVAVAEASARIALEMADQLEHTAPGSTAARRARAAAHGAETAAQGARRLVDERNHAYTFHTTRSFSFGEGWYLAAAAVLAGVTIQIEPGTDRTLQAETFLRAAGLAARIAPYRPRPRAMKQVTELVGRAFEADPLAAQARLRAAFLGDEPVARDLTEWIDKRLSTDAVGGHVRKKVLLWIRDGAHHPGRNTSYGELVALADVVLRAGLVPILTGDALRGEPVPEGARDMILFWKDPIFGRADQRRAQLGFFEYLRARHGLVGQIGVTTAGMDGPALMGLPTLYLTDAPNVRMREWVGRVPGYEELVREDGYRGRVAHVLDAWARATS
jgi:hypothetical protein